MFLSAYKLTEPTQVITAFSICLAIFCHANLCAAQPDQAGEGLDRQLLTSYQNCRKAVLSTQFIGEANKRTQTKQIKRGLRDCRRTHPSVAHLNRCRKDALKAYRGHQYLPEALKDCRNQFNEVQFDPYEVQPLKTLGKAKFFAGFDLSGVLPFSKNSGGEWLVPSRQFECAALNQYLRGGTGAEHMLFGNELKHFIPLRDSDYPELAQKLGITWPGKKQIIDQQMVGQLYADSRRESILSYLPTVPCRYDAKPGEAFTAVKIYYLVDRRKKLALPYFGIIFFSDTQNVAVSDLADSVTTEFTKDFDQNAIQSTSKSGVRLISQYPIKEFDHEGDPKNLCRFPRQHHWVAAIGSHPSQNTASYLLVNNVKNLCRFGDRAASRLKRELRKKS